MKGVRCFSSNYEECKGELLSFRNANRDEKRDMHYFDWRYLGRPNKAEPIIVWAESDHGEKIGALSVILHHFIVNNRIDHIGILGDISVVKEWRGRGIAQQMFRYLTETEEVKQIRAMVVLPNKDAARALVKSGWRNIAIMQRYAKLIKVERKLTELLNLGWLSRLVAIPVNYLLKVLSRETYVRDVDGYEGTMIDVVDQRFDGLWNAAKKDGIIIGQRNTEYLAWRYMKHPLVKYHIYTLSLNSELCGYIVYHSGGGTCYIDDLFCISRNKHPRYLLRLFLRHIRSTDIERVTLSMNNDIFNLGLSECGFVKRFSDWAIMVFTGGKPDNSLLLNGSKWYLTYGDKDT